MRHELDDTFSGLSPDDDRGWQAENRTGTGQGENFLMLPLALLDHGAMKTRRFLGPLLIFFPSRLLVNRLVGEHWWRSRRGRNVAGRALSRKLVLASFTSVAVMIVADETGVPYNGGVVHGGKQVLRDERFKENAERDRLNDLRHLYQSLQNSQSTKDLTLTVICSPGLILNPSNILCPTDCH